MNTENVPSQSGRSETPQNFDDVLQVLVFPVLFASSSR